VGFAQETGYVPTNINTILLDFMNKINEQFGTTYTVETFVGTNFYKYAYAWAQKYSENEIATGEIFVNLQQYFNVINGRISRPVTTNPGIVEKFGIEGYIASLKPMIEADAGKISICVDVDEDDTDYEDLKLEINTLISQITSGGTVTQGTEVSAIVLSNGQSFNFKYFLPDRLEVLLRLTITLSENNQVVVGSPDDMKVLLLQNINARYRLGRNFEPQRYFSVSDAPWASNVKLEYALPSAPSTWLTAVYDADFDELFDAKLENITVVEN